MRLKTIAAIVGIGLLGHQADAQAPMSLDEYEICGSVAVAFGSLLPQLRDIQRVGVYLDLDPETEREYRSYISTFVEVFPPLIAEANGIERRELYRIMSPMTNYMTQELESGIRRIPRSGPSDFLDVYGRHSRLLVQCAEMAGLR